MAYDDARPFHGTAFYGGPPWFAKEAVLVGIIIPSYAYIMDLHTGNPVNSDENVMVVARILLL